MTVSEDKEGATVTAAGNVTAQESATDQQEGAMTKQATTEMHTNASELPSMTTAGPGKPPVKSLHRQQMKLCDFHRARHRKSSPYSQLLITHQRFKLILQRFARMLYVYTTIYLPSYISVWLIVRKLLLIKCSFLRFSSIYCYYYYYYYYQCTDLSDAVTRTMQGHFTES